MSQTQKGKQIALSFAQERLWFIENYENGSSAYNIPILMQLTKTVDIDVLEQAILNTIKRHEVLRSLIKTDNSGNGYQEICDLTVRPLLVNKFNLQTNNELNNFMTTEINYIFKLDNEYPLRVSIVSYDNTQYLLIVIHHIACDGWSVDILLRDIYSHYDFNIKQNTDNVNGIRSAKLNLPSLSIQYKDFAVWQRSYLSGDKLEQQISYWRKKLSSYELLNLMTDKPRPKLIIYNGDDVCFTVSESISIKLRSLAKELGVSLYSTLLSGFYLLLRVYSNQDDIIVGTPIANRQHKQLQNMIGFFVNSLALRSNINENLSVKDYIQVVGKDVVDAQLHQDLPFEKLVEELNVAKDTSRHPIFQVMFGVQNFGSNIPKEIFTINSAINLYEYYKIAKFDITVMIDDGSLELKGSFNYATSLFKRSTIESYIETYTSILKQFIEKPYIKICKLSYLDKHNYQKILYDWNSTYQNYSDKTIKQLFEEQTRLTPNNIAVVYDDIQITYQELDQRTNQLAHYLQSTYNIAADDLIALCLNRSEYMIIAILAILKSGAAYVPLDPYYPEERILYILNDAKVKAICINTVYQDKIEKIFANYTLFLDKNRLVKFSYNTHMLVVLDSDEFIVRLNNYTTDSILESTINGSNLAYVLYTSGTTGKPKGVMLDCKGCVSRLLSMRRYNNMSESDVVLFKTNYIFDVSFSDIFTTLLSGAKLIITQNVFDIEEIRQKLSKYNVTICHFVPSQFAVLIQEVNFNEEFPCLKLLMFSGEKLLYSLLSGLSRQNYIFLNYYGPTETGEVTVYNFAGQDDLYNSNNMNVSNIGRPLDNIKCYILSSSLQPLPIGAVGELYISGIGIARGYLNLPELTKERFIPNPYFNSANEECGYDSVLYKTGDLVRYLFDGTIEYIGRNDFQVKINGHRIEPGEIESLLHNYPGIKQAVVIAKEPEDNYPGIIEHKYLAGYYVAEYKLDEEAVLRYLSEHLPDYMVPRGLVYLTQLPLTNNGKLDCNSLPAYNFIKTIIYVAPKNVLEQRICAIYSEVLGISTKQIGIEDDFFKLGGNSILAIQLISRLNNNIFTPLGFKTNVAAIFKYKTISALISSILIGNSNDIVVIPVLKSLDQYQPVTLSFAQERLWFIETYEGGSNAYNIPLFSQLSEYVNLDILKQAVLSAVERHEILYSMIKTDANGKGYQLLGDLDVVPIQLTSHKLYSKEVLNNLINQEVNYIFKLATEYPIRVSFIELHNTWYILMVFHHIAFDGWSADVLLHDIHGYYDYYIQLRYDADDIRHELVVLDLPVLDIQYRDFAVWQRTYMSGDRLQLQLEYWKNKLSNYEVLNLVTDKPRPSQINYAGDDIFFTLDEVTSIKLREVAKLLGVSLYTILLSGFNLLMRIYSNQNDIVVGTPVANRHYEQLVNMVGFFINNLVLRSQVDSKFNIVEYIKMVGLEVIEAQLYQDLPFEKLVEELHVLQDSSRHPIFQVMFSVQHFGQKTSDKIFLSTDINIFNYYKVAKFDLMLIIDDSKPRLAGILNYATSLFTRSTLECYIRTYLHIIGQLVNMSDKTINELDYLSGYDYQRVVYDWNSTAYDHAIDNTISQMFEAQVERTPDCVAVVYEDKQLTYLELNQKSNQMAHYLRNTYQIKGDDLIALYLDRSEHMLAAILAILKSGAAYVPLDLSYPEERILYILNDARASVVLTNKIYEERLQLLIARLSPMDYIKNVTHVPSKPIVLSIDDQDVFTNQVVTNPVLNITSTNLAYIIYTSGTTGNPKGVMIEHASIINRIKWMNSTYPLYAHDVILQKTPYVFDVSVWELFWGIGFGVRIVFAKPDGHKDIYYLRELINKENISIVHFVPTMLNVFENALDTAGSVAKFRTLRYIFCSGEVLSLKQVQQCHKLLPNVAVHNLYGPTEASVDVLYYDCSSKKLEKVCIGKPIHNTIVYILNADLNLLPIGAIGELYIGGISLARGYLNLTELTAQNFSYSFLQTKESQKLNKNIRLYKTGDLVRYLPDGNIEYIGRNDTQIKIKGFRIEPKEIEVVLNAYPKIKQAIVLAFDHKYDSVQLSENKYLIGYYVTEHDLDENDIYNHLNKYLPEYMMPNILRRIEYVPLTVNGKLDRKLLPYEFSSSDTNYIAPRSALELLLCNLWQEVLNILQVGVTDDFFRLGGDSILSIRLVALMRQNNVVVTVREIFLYRTISNILKFCNNFVHTVEEIYIPFSMLTCEDYQRVISSNNLNIDEIEDIYLASYLQMGMLIESTNNDTAYHDVFSYTINAKFDIAKFTMIWQDLINKHEQLRTCFIEDKKGYLNCIYKNVFINNQVNYILDDIEIVTFVNEEKTRGLDFKEPGLFRLFIQEHVNNKFVLIFSFHHAIADGWSIASLIAEFMSAYKNSSTIYRDLIPLYVKFVAKEQKILSDNRYKEFWSSYLSGYDVNNISLILNKDTVLKGQVIVTKQLNSTMSLKILLLAKKLKISPDVILLAVYSLVLSRFYNTDDLVVGTVVSNRLEESGGDKLFGLHLNTIPIRFRINNDDFSNMENYITKVVIDRFKVDEYKLYPYGKIKSDLGEYLDLYQCAFNYVHFHVVEDKYNLGDISTEFSYEKTNISLVFHVFRVLDKFSISFVGNNQFIDISMLNNILLYMEYYLEGLIDTNSTNIVPVHEYQQLMHNWNDTKQAFPRNKNIGQLFEEQVVRTPNNIALIFGDIQLTYQELNSRSNQLAHYLKDIYQIKADDLVALCLDRSEYMLIAIIAVFKAGAAYVPLDPGSLESRLSYILKDSKAKVLLANEIYQDKLNRVIHIDIYCQTKLEIIDNIQMTQVLLLQLKSNLNLIINSNNLAYVMYTSGTTGIPKGVMIEHSGIVNRIIWMNDSYPLSYTDKILQKTPYIFDVSVWELLWGIWYGASVIFAQPDGHKDPNYLIDMICLEKVTICHFVPSMLGVFLDALKIQSDSIHSKDFSLRYLFCSGEALPLSLVQECYKLLPFIQLYNLYGPTEASIDVLYYKCTNNLSKVAIGKPIYNTQAYILDARLTPVPIGVVGELYISGAGVARGYLNLSALTAQKFIVNPFAPEDAQQQSAVLYKTGDLVRYLADGNIEYMGRNDFQVKRRGFRVELGEIESALNVYPGIKCSVAVVSMRQEDSANKYLLGYYVADNVLDEKKIFSHLSTILPEYMMPDNLIYIKYLPLTRNGKLDRGALPAFEFNKLNDYVGPRDEVEQHISSAYAIILELTGDKIGIYDDFFKLGGNSILAVSLSHLIGRELDVKLSVADIFHHKTIAGLREYIRTVTAKNFVIPNADKLNRYRLSFSQERIWFLEQYEQGSNVYHMPMLMSLAKDTNLDCLIKSIQEIVVRHEVLRSIFIQDENDGIDYQVIQKTPLKINYIVCNDVYEYEQLLFEGINTSFNLRRDYPIRVCIYDIKEELVNFQDNKRISERYLLINMHHIASDGWSLDILQRELLEYYYYFNGSKALNLANLSIQYKDFASWQRIYLDGPELTKQLNYWIERLSGYETLNLAIDKTRPALVSYAGASIQFSLTKELSKKLKLLAMNNGYTMYTVLLAGFFLLLNKYTRQVDIMVGSPIANRHYEQIKDLIGFFINMIVQREILDVNQSILFLTENIHQHLIDAQQYQDLPFDKLVEELSVERDQSRHPLFQVMFTVQGFGSKMTDPLSQLFRQVDIKDIHAVTRYDLEFFIDDSRALITGDIVYATSLYNKSTILRLADHYINILTQMVDEPHKALKDYCILNKEEYRQLIYDWNPTNLVNLGRKTIHQLFEEQVERTPYNIAIICGEEKLTYYELNQRSNQLAHYIISCYTISNEDLIALCLDRSSYMLIAMFATLKLGASYVPLDPDYPPERILYILTDTKAKMMLASHRCQIQLNFLAYNDVLYIDSDDVGMELGIQRCTNLSKDISSNNLAYVIYTSGTTGLPKGVMIEHQSYVDLINSISELYFKNQQQINTYSFTNYVFDIFGLEYGLPLLSGGLLTLGYTEFNVLDCSMYHFIQMTPSFCGLKLDNLINTNNVYFFIGGEVLNNNLLQRILSRNIKLINVYGPTETTIWSVSKEYDMSDNNDYTNSIIGKPFINETCYILDDNFYPVPLGVIGELFIGGAGLARGYLNNPELTLQKFIPNQFRSDEEKLLGQHEKLYCTGDLVRYRLDGNIEYIGRNDLQIKLRGFRVELEEIEKVLLQIKGIKHACVVAKNSVNDESNKYLVGYYVLDRQAIVNDTSILATWEGIYDNEYSETLIMPNLIMSDFGIWKSFITSLPIPITEMEEWRDSTIARIMELQPVSVLEIGVGTGLIMYPLLDHIMEYTGLDISKAVIKRHNDYLRSTHYKVDLYHMTADRIDEIGSDKSFDCIILNSVCQYFPNIKYFSEVLIKSIKKLRVGDKIFVGDVRNYSLQRELIREKLDYEHKSYTDNDIDQLLKQEKELLISPEYFSMLAKQSNEIKVDILGKSDKYNNELSRYRYDIVITVLMPVITLQDTLDTLIKLCINFYNIPLLNKLTQNQVMSELCKYLPEYMLPNVLLEMDVMPLTVNGKLDRKALPDPVFTTTNHYLAPRTKLESEVCAIYADVLGVPIENFGIQSELFKFGGDSIISIRIVSKIRQQLGINISIKDMFNYKTIESLFDNVINTNIVPFAVLKEEGLLEGNVPLLPIQKLFFKNILYGIYQLEPHWNQAVLIRVEKLDCQLLIVALNKIISYHDAFRLCYKQDVQSEFGYTQYYTKEIPNIHLNYLDIATISEAEGSPEFHNKLDQILISWKNNGDLSEKSQLYSFGYIEGYTDNSSRIYIALHRLIIDSLSWSILVDDLKKIYTQLQDLQSITSIDMCRDKSVEYFLGNKGTSYRQWTKLVNTYGNLYKSEAEYWHNILVDLKANRLNLESLAEGKDIQNVVNLELNQKLTTKLLLGINYAYHAEINNLLLTAFGLALNGIVHNKVNYILLRGYGREELTKNIEISRTVGWFTTMYPFKLSITPNEVEVSIQQVKNELDRVPNKGLGFGAIMGYNFGDLPQISFNYLGQFGIGYVDTHYTQVLDNIWKIMDESSGINIPPQQHSGNDIISVTGFVYNNKLNFKISTRLDKNDLNRLSESFHLALKRVVDEI